MLDEEQEQRHLAQAEIHIRKAKSNIIQQGKVIVRLTRAGRDTTEAKEMLALFTRILENMLAHCDLILRSLVAIQRKTRSSALTRKEEPPV